MKKILLITLGSLILIFGGILVTLKIMFPPEKIKALIVPEVETALNGRKVQVGDVSLSVFPTLGIELTNFEISELPEFGKTPFVKLKEIEIAVKLLPLFSSSLEIDKILLVEPEINVFVNSNGIENFADLTSADTTATEETTTESPVALSLAGMKILDGKISYTNEQTKQQIFLSGINQHIEFDLDKKLENINASGFFEIQEIIFADESVSKEKIKGLYFKLTHESHINLPVGAFSLKEATLQLNQVKLKTSGSVKNFNDEVMNVDLSVESNQIDIGKLLTLIPSDAVEGIEDLKSSGLVQLKVQAKGELGNEKSPSISGLLKVSDAFVQYPIVPKPIEKINVDIVFTDKELTVTKFSSKMGSNSLDLTANVKNFEKPFVKAEIQTNFNLAEAKDFYPLEKGLEISGLLEANVKVEGLVDEMSVQNPPKLSGKIQLAKGSVKYPEVPKPISNLNIDAIFTEKELDLRNLSANLGQNPISLKAKLKDLQNPYLDADLKATMNLAEVKDFVPLEDGMTLDGKVSVSLNAKGKAKTPEAMAVDGEISLEKINVGLSKETLLKPVSEVNGKVKVTNKLISASKVSLKIGKSDIALQNLRVTDFLALVLGEEKAKTPNVNFEVVSTLLDVDEFLPVTETTEKAEPMAPLPDLNLNGKVNFQKVRFDKINYENVSANFSLKDQVVDLNNLRLDLFKGKISGDVNWNAKNAKKSKFDAKLSVKNVAAEEYFKSDNFLATAGTGKSRNLHENVSGKLSLDGSYRGVLDDTLGLIPTSLNGKGSLKLDNAIVKNFKGLQKLSKVPGLDALNFDAYEVSHADHSYTIENGKILLKNIDYKGRTSDFTGNGWVSLDDKIDLRMSMLVSKANSDKINSAKLLGGVGGKYADEVIKDKNGRVVLDFKITGNASDPSVDVDLEPKKQKAKEIAKRETEKKIKEEADKLKKEAEKAKKKAEEEAKKKIKKGLKGLFD
ncbi:MAG: DUF3971 domain-containing protein [Calditrichaeota bacterium]|nr:MAG: DUF3971 domain-containing protein [Calditrichota bacterium]